MTVEDADSNHIGDRRYEADIVRLSRVAGTLLMASLLILILAFLIVVVSSALPAFSASLRGSLAEVVPHVQTFRITNFLYAIGWVALLLGFVALTVLLVKARDLVVAVLALAATGVATVLAILEATFHMGVTTWAAEQAAGGEGAIPVFYTATRDWVSAFKLLYIGLGLSAQVGYGVALLRTAVLPDWVGRTAIAWGLIWLSLVAVGVGAPAIVFVIPAAIGLALLIGERTAPATSSGEEERAGG